MAAAGPAFGLSSGGRLPWRRGCLVSIVRVRGLTAHLPDDVGVAQVGVPSIPIAIRPPARPLARPPSLHNGNRFCSYRMYAARPRSSTSSSFIYTYSLDQASGPTEVLPLPLLIHTALVLLRSSLCLFTIQTHILLASDVRCAAVAAAAAATAAYITVFALRKGQIELHHSFFSFALLLFAVAVVRKMYDWATNDSNVSSKKNKTMIDSFLY